jgi:pimeloyl-ACP methyl ester carboxylesterase
MANDFIFLHGGAQGSWVWSETIEALKSQGQDMAGAALALDVPGCGTKRSLATDEMDPQQLLANLLADIDAANLEDVILVGHSQAGTILPLLVKARPGRFRHVVYVSCLAPFGDQTALSWRSEMPGESALSSHAPGSPERFQAMFCNDMEGDAADHFLARLGHDSWPASSYGMSGWHYEHLADMPSTYVLCLRDAALLPSWQQIFAQRVHAKVIVSIDAGHQVMNTRPHELTKVLLAIARDSA